MLLLRCWSVLPSSRDVDAAEARELQLRDETVAELWMFKVG